MGIARLSCRRPLLRLGPVVLGLVLAAGAAHADALIDRAAALVQGGSAREAFDLLDAQEAVRAGDPAFDAAMGSAAHAAGQYSRAVLAWERVVAAQPDNMAAQVALARALYAVGDQRGVLALSERALFVKTT
jgi:outer membrane protein